MPGSILDMKVKDYMTAESAIKTVQKSDPLQKVVPLLMNAGISNVAVFDGKEFAGFFGKKQLARFYRKPIHQTKVGEHIIRPPAFLQGAGIVDAAEAMYRLNCKILPVMDGKILIGVISESDILRAAIDSGEINSKKIEEFMTPEPLTIRDTDTLGAAISKLRDKNISRLPVVGKSGELAGVFESADVMREMYTNEPEYGEVRAASKNPVKGGISVESYVSNEIPGYKIAVKTLMKTLPVTAKVGDSMVLAFKELIDRNMTSVVVVDGNNRPVGIVAPKDIIQFIARFKQKEVIYIQISGLESEDLPAFQKEEVHRMIDEAVRKLAKTVRLQFFTMHFKSYSTEGKNRKFSIRCKADTDLGLYATREYGWDIIDATSRALETFEKLVIGKTQKVRTKMMDRNRNKKNAEMMRE